MQYNHIKIDCLNSDNGCDFCDARCPHYVDKDIVLEFLLSKKDILHDLSIIKIKERNNADI